MAFLIELAFLISTCATKVSVLLFYRRVTKGTLSRPIKFAITGAIAFVVIYAVSLILLVVLQCNPTNAYWKSLAIGYHKDWHCHDTRFMNAVSGALSSFTDLWVISSRNLYYFDLLTPMTGTLSCFLWQC